MTESCTMVVLASVMQVTGGTEPLPPSSTSTGGKGGAANGDRLGAAGVGDAVVGDAVVGDAVVGDVVVGAAVVGDAPVGDELGGCVVSVHAFLVHTG